jgi:hypothetical protein
MRYEICLILKEMMYLIVTKLKKTSLRFRAYYNVPSIYIRKIRNQSIHIIKFAADFKLSSGFLASNFGSIILTVILLSSDYLVNQNEWTELSHSALEFKIVL